MTVPAGAGGPVREQDRHHLRVALRAVQCDAAVRHDPRSGKRCSGGRDEQAPRHPCRSMVLAAGPVVAQRGIGPDRRLLTLDHWLSTLRCREQPILEARASCYAAAARLLEVAERRSRDRGPGTLYPLLPRSRR